MQILLVNPNRYHHPPVIPLGIEYLLGALARTSHAAAAVDLCFAADPAESLRRAVETHNPDIVGISVRQIDTVLFRNNEFFLDEIRRYVDLCRRCNRRVVLGGSGFSIMPQACLEYIGADFGVRGPGEAALPQLLDSLAAGALPPRVTDGYERLPAAAGGFPRITAVDCAPYLENGGIAAFRTQIGCTGNCFFCVEAGAPVCLHDPRSVADEVVSLKAQGHTRLHLCDSEFNINLDHCVSVCRALCREAAGIDWALYMKPEPVSEELFDVLAQSGASLITLSIDTANYTADSPDPLTRFFALAERNAIAVIVDLSVGFPGESPAHAGRMLDFLDTQPVKSVGVNSYYRVYPGTPLYRRLTAEPSLQRHIVAGDLAAGCVRPVFFCCLPEEIVRGLVRGRPRFRVEGFDMASNYQRVDTL